MMSYHPRGVSTAFHPLRTIETIHLTKEQNINDKLSSQRQEEVEGPINVLKR